MTAVQAAGKEPTGAAETLEFFFGVPASELKYAANVPGLGSGLADAVSFAAKDDCRRISRTAEDARAYLRDLGGTIDGPHPEGTARPGWTDVLLKPTRDKAAVRLDQRYDALAAIRDSYVLLPPGERRRYVVNTAGWDRLSAALSHVVLRDGRLSRLPDLLYWCEFALIVSDYRGLPVVRNLMKGKGNLIAASYLEAKELFEGAHYDLLKVLESRYVRSHNLKRALSDVDDLSFELMDDRAEDAPRVFLANGAGHVLTACVEVLVHEQVPANIAFNREKAAQPAAIAAGVGELKRRMSAYCAMRDALLGLARYLRVLDRDRAALEARPSTMRPEDGFEIPLTETAFVPVAEMS